MITGLVAAILNARELVINRGSRDGVSNGMIFAVLERRGLDIHDPETGELLGSVFRPKSYVRVSRVEGRLSVGRTFRKYKANIGGSSSIFTGGNASLSQLLAPPKWVDRTESLRIDEAEWEEIDPEESIVQVGDRVEQVADPDQDVAAYVPARQRK